MTPSSYLDFAGRVAIVTGGGRGIGRAHCLALAARGAAVVVNDLGATLAGEPGDSDTAARVAEEIQAAGGRAVADSTSVTAVGGAERIVARAIDEFGSLDILVNNAGFLRDRTISKMQIEDFDAVIDVHLRGTFLMGKAAWPVFRDRGYGRIVNTTSVAGLLGNFGQANYAAAKAGIVGLTRVQAIEGERYGIRANVLEPAAMTRMSAHTLGEIGARLSPELASAAAVVLVHEQCPVNGDIINAGGGRVARVMIAETQGLYEADPTPESVFASWSVVENMAGVAYPRSFPEEFALLTRNFTE